MSKFILENCPKNENGHWMAKTRDGKDVVIYTDKGQGLFNLVGEMLCGIEWCTASWNRGAFLSKGESDNDLISPPPPKRVLDFWVNVYGDGLLSGDIYMSESTANIAAASSRTACVHIVHEYTPGEGV